MRRTKMFFVLAVLAAALFVFIHKKFHTSDVLLFFINTLCIVIPQVLRTIHIEWRYVVGILNKICFLGI